MDKYYKGLVLAFTNYLNKIYYSVSRSMNEYNYTQTFLLDDNEDLDKAKNFLASRFTSVELGKATKSAEEIVANFETIGQSFGLTSAAKSKLRKEVLDRVTSVDDTIKKQMKKVFETAAKSDLTLDETKALLRNEFRGIVSDGKIDTIAQTEWRSAQNYGQNHGLEKLANKGKKVIRTWVASGLNVRESHLQNDGEEREIGEKFPNGMEYPMQDGFPPEEVINCNCYLEARVIDEETKKYKIFKLNSKHICKEED